MRSAGILSGKPPAKQPIEYFDNNLPQLARLLASTGEPVIVERLPDNSGCKVSSGDVVGYVSNAARFRGEWLYFTDDVIRALGQLGVDAVRRSQQDLMHRLVVVDLERQVEEVGDWSSDPSAFQAYYEKALRNPNHIPYVQQMYFDRILNGMEPPSELGRILAEYRREQGMTL